MEDFDPRAGINAVGALADAIGRYGPARSCAVRGILRSLIRSEDERVD